MSRPSVSAGRDVERLVEGAVGGPDAERGVEDQQRLAHRVHDVLGVVLDVLDQRSSFHHRYPPACFERSPRRGVTGGRRGRVMGRDDRSSESGPGRSSPPGRRKLRRREEGGLSFRHAQSLRRPAATALLAEDEPVPVCLDVGRFLPGIRRDSGSSPALRHVASPRMRQAEAASRSVFRLGIGPWPHTDHDHSPAARTVQPRVAPPEGKPLSIIPGTAAAVRVRCSARLGVTCGHWTPRLRGRCRAISQDPRRTAPPRTPHGR